MIRGKTIICHLENSFFLKCLFLLTSQVPKKWTYHLHNSRQNTLWTLINCCLTYVTCDKTRKSRPNVLHHWKDCLFFKTFFFQQPIRTCKSPYMFQSKCQNSLWPLIKWSLMFVTLNDTRKNELLSSWKQLIFEMFVSIDLSGPKKVILWFAQFLSKYLGDPDKLLPDICHLW